MVRVRLLVACAALALVRGGAGRGTGARWEEQPLDSPATFLRSPYGKGCSKVYLDVGSNVGVHIRFLYEPHLFPGSTILASKLWAEAFGANFPHDPTLCAFGFEPNPRHRDRNERLGRRFRAARRRVEFFSVAARAEPGVITIAAAAEASTNSSDNDWKFRLPASAASSALSSPPKQSTKNMHDVSAIDLTGWVREELLGGKASSRPVIVMKLDVEGDELPVLERMRSTGVLCAIHTIHWEFHPPRAANKRLGADATRTRGVEKVGHGQASVGHRVTVALANGSRVVDVTSDIIQRYAKYALLWDFIFSHMPPHDIEEKQADRLAPMRAVWLLRQRQQAPRTTRDEPDAGVAEATDGACLTRFVALDDEHYVLVRDAAPPRSWEVTVGR